MADRNVLNESFNGLIKRFSTLDSNSKCHPSTEQYWFQDGWAAVHVSKLAEMFSSRLYLNAAPY